MATKSKYEFVKELDNSLLCPICLDAVHDAVETKCCGMLLCKLCSEKIAACPMCKASPFATQDSLFMRRKVKQLHIYCVNKDCCSEISIQPYPVHPNSESLQNFVSGKKLCTWSGEINELASHLHKNCPHTTIICQYNCGAEIVRCQKDVHEDKVCRKRPFSCWFCDMKATAEEIDGHARKCDKRPIECPNKCSAELLQRELQLHLEQCPLQEISCEFEQAGCEEKVLRKDYNSHIEDNTHKHLSLQLYSFSTQLVNMKDKIEDIRVKEYEQQEIMKKSFAELKNTTNSQVRAMQNYILKMKEEMEKMEKKVKLLSQVQIQHINITVPCAPSSVSQSSRQLYLHGYCMSVECTEYMYLKGTLQVSLLLHPGQYDDNLSWPVEGVVTLVLLHSKDEERNKELEYHFNKIDRLHHMVGVAVKRQEMHCDSREYQHGVMNKEYQLLVKSSTITA